MDAGFPNDDLAVKRFYDGDQGAFADLVNNHSGWVLGTCRKLLGSVAAAQDAHQDIWFSIFRALGKRRYQLGTRFSAWLYTTTKNACLQKIRERKRTPEILTDLSEAEVARLRIQPSCGKAENEQKQLGLDRLVWRCLGTLSPDNAVLVILRYMEGCSIKETATKLGKGRAYVKIRAHRALRQLRRCIERNGQRTATRGSGGMSKPGKESDNG